jgi:hypothetical protein
VLPAGVEGGSDVQAAAAGVVALGDGVGDPVGDSLELDGRGEVPTLVGCAAVVVGAAGVVVVGGGVAAGCASTP